jgi:magnesium-transporting ATPase (P-type)
MSDNAVNSRKANVLRDGKFGEVEWLSVKVGEVVLLQNNDQVPVSELFKNKPGIRCI